MSYVKHLVSKKKRRFIDDEFDLDLAYIKPNIVAMGFPSENLEGVYRNHLDDVHRFLELKHKDKYKVYNLCSEKSYDPAKFGNRVSVYGFDDHNAPPFELILPYCEDMDTWLSTPETVAIVHCKAGKGRTGVMICAYLLYKKYFTAALDAMNYYADARTQNKKGVTIPSQRRYITYFGYFARNGFKYVPKTILLNSLTFIGVPTITSGTCNPSLIICQTKVILHKSRTVEVRKTQNDIEMDIGSVPIPICGDIKIDVFNKDLFKKERMLVFWFNTNFLELGVTMNRPDGGGIDELGLDEQGNRVIQYEITKFHLDKCNKDKKHKLFPENFKVRLNITIPRSSTSDSVDAKRNVPVEKSSVSKSATNKDKDKSASKGGSNVKDGAGLNYINEEKSTSHGPSNKHIKNYTSNPKSNSSSGLKTNENSRFYVSSDGNKAINNPLNRSPTPNHLGASHLSRVSKEIMASMEGLELKEDADQLSSSDDDEDEEMFL